MSCVVERLVEPVILRRASRRRGASAGSVRLMEDRGEVEPARLPVLDRRPHVEPIDAADHLVDGPEAELRHQLAHLLGDEAEEVLDELRLAGELLAQLRVLRRDADRAGVEMADAHHDAARDDERRGREAELLGAEQRRDDDVAAGLAAGRRPARRCGRAARSCISTCCVSARPSSHGTPPCLIDGQRRGAGAAVVARDQHDVGVRLRDAGGNRADARLRATSFTWMRAAGWRSSGRR